MTKLGIKLVQKALATSCAFVLACGMVPLASSEVTSNGSVASQSAYAADAAVEPEGQNGELANSWRYSDGYLLDSSEIEQGATDGQASQSSAESGVMRAMSTSEWSYVDGRYVNDRGETIDRAVAKGIDVSYAQGWIDWEKVKADGVDFAIIRCGYGNDYSSQDDTWWEYNVSECERLGIPYGVYLYSYAESTADAQSEVDHAVRLLEGHNPTYPVYYDLEENYMIGRNDFLAEIATTFCDGIENAGYAAGVYSSLNWWNYYLTDDCFNRWERWVAQWNHACSYDGTYHVWQSTSDGEIDGINGRVDVDFEMDWNHSSFVAPETYDEASNPSTIRITDSSVSVKSRSASNVVMDVAAASKDSGATVTTWSNTYSLWQLFKLETDSEGFTRIVSRNSGLCIGVAGWESLGCGTNVCQIAEGDGARVQWVMEEAQQGSYYLRLRGTNLYLDVSGGVAGDGTNLQLWTQSASNVRRGQMFYFVHDVEHVVSDGFYIIRSADNTDYVADVVASGIEDGVNVTLWDYTGADNQIFQIYHMYDGYYKVAAVNSWRALDVVAGGIANGTNVTQWCQYASDNQAWYIHLNDDGTVSFEAKCSGLLLDVQGGYAGAGVNLQTWETTDNNGGAGQRFYLERTYL